VRPHTGYLSDQFPRRTALAGTVAIATLATIGAAPTAVAAPASSYSDEELLVRIAGTIAVLPVPFPSFDDRGAAAERATKKRLQLVLARMRTPDRGALFDGLAQVRKVMSPQDDNETVVRAMGRAASGFGVTAGLTAVVSTAIATISSRFEPGQRPAAELWLDYARRFATLATVAGEGSSR
jgi:MFS family permease